MAQLNFEEKMMLKKIEGLTNLPIPSEHIMKIMLLLRDKEVKVKPLIESIERDQSLVAQILKMVNSGFFGLRQVVDSVESAVTLLGLNNIKQIVYSASIMNFYSADEQKEWHHSYSSSVLMANIMKSNDIPAQSNLPLTMLMHDIGKVVLRELNPKKFEIALRMSTEKNMPCYQAEDLVMNINHAKVGSWLLEKWQMTDDILVPISYHHFDGVPEVDEYLTEIALTQFINWVDCQARGISSLPPSKDLLTAAGFDEIDLDYWINYQVDLIAKLEGEVEQEVVEIDGMDTGTTRISRSGLVEEPKRAPAESKPTPVDPSTTETDTGTKMISREGLTAEAQDSEDYDLEEMDNTSTAVIPKSAFPPPKTEVPGSSKAKPADLMQPTRKKKKTLRLFTRKKS